jgi:rhomboid protease GluP
MEDYDEAIRRAPGDESAYRSRGALHFYLGDFVAAADDLGRVAQSEPDDPYAMLWTYLAAARGDAEAAQRRLAQAATQGGPGWPRPVLDLFLGERTVGATLAAAIEAPQRCEAEFYVGEWQLLRGDRTAAVSALKVALDACPKSFIESKGAQAELKRIGQ